MGTFQKVLLWSSLGILSCPGIRQWTRSCSFMQFVTGDQMTKLSLKGVLILLFALAVAGSGSVGMLLAADPLPDKPLVDHEKNLPPGFHTWAPGPIKVIPGGTFHPAYPVAPPGWPPFPPYYHPYYGYYPFYEPEKHWYQEEPPTPAGRLMLLVDPIQAEAFVDGYPLQRHPDLSYAVGLLEGEHRVEVTAEGYESYHRTMDIKGGERISLTIRLKPKATP
jgi:hypothetical protein